MTALTIKRTLVLPTALVPNSLYMVRNVTSGFLEITVVGEDGASFRTLALDDFAAWLAANPIDTAGSLSTSRSISVTGDAEWTVNFDGSGDVSAALTLADMNIEAGVYGNFRVDTKGRVVAIRNLEAVDIPELDHTTVTSSAALKIVEEW